MDEIGERPFPCRPACCGCCRKRRSAVWETTRSFPIDVRVIAATNVNIREKARTGELPGDLYYRLDVLHLLVPPLRSRLEDLEDLVPYLTRDFDCDGRPVTFERAAVERLKSLDWPGNVRSCAMSASG